ncbi:MAG: MFS transporter, partial [Gemmataceae bacterium]
MILSLLREKSWLFWICFSSFLWAVGFGITTPLASLFLDEAGYGPWSLGLNASLYYLGLALASPFVPRLMKKANRGCVFVGLSLDAFAVGFFPFGKSLVAYHLFRFLAGVGTALCLIPLETMVSRDAKCDDRGRSLAFYAFCVSLGIGIGALSGLMLKTFGDSVPFLTSACLTLLSIPFALKEVPSRYRTIPSKHSFILPPLAQSVLCKGSAWVQGFLEAGTLTFLSLYLLSCGHSEWAASQLLGFLFAGVVIAQLPLGWLADSLGKKQTLLICHGILLFGLSGIYLASNYALLSLLFFLLGASCGALYPLGLALQGDRMPS